MTINQSTNQSAQHPGDLFLIADELMTTRLDVGGEGQVSKTAQVSKLAITIYSMT